jgi:hypothetical protein
VNYGHEKKWKLLKTLLITAIFASSPFVGTEVLGADREEGELSENGEASSDSSSPLPASPVVGRQEDGESRDLSSEEKEARTDEASSTPSTSPAPRRKRSNSRSRSPELQEDRSRSRSRSPQSLEDAKRLGRYNPPQRENMNQKGRGHHSMNPESTNRQAFANFNRSLEEHNRTREEGERAHNRKPSNEEPAKKLIESFDVKSERNAAAGENITYRLSTSDPRDRAQGTRTYWNSENDTHLTIANDWKPGDHVLQIHVTFGEKSNDLNTPRVDFSVDFSPGPNSGELEPKEAELGRAKANREQMSEGRRIASAFVEAVK